VLLHKSAVAGSPRTLLEVVRARYTITAANGAMLESVPFILGVSHDGTLERQFAAMHETAGYIAARVAEVTR
jgi:hypothetical protein